MFCGLIGPPLETVCEKLFSLAFGVKAVIPLEMEIPSIRTIIYHDEENERRLRGKLDLLEEKRNEAEIRNAVYRQRSARYYIRKSKKGSLKLEILC